MATDLENLQTRKSNVLEELAGISATTAGGLPNHSGKAASDHVGYKKSLYDELKDINELIEGIAGGWELVSEMTT